MVRHPGMPVATFRRLKLYCTLKWLILEDPPPSRERDDAWLYITLELVAAPIMKIGLRAKEAQRARARKPRGKIANEARSQGSSASWRSGPPIGI
jgi:hypothetical protein